MSSKTVTRDRPRIQYLFLVAKSVYAERSNPLQEDNISARRSYKQASITNVLLFRDFFPNRRTSYAAVIPRRMSMRLMAPISGAPSPSVRCFHHTAVKLIPYRLMFPFQATTTAQPLTIVPSLPSTGLAICLHEATPPPTSLFSRKLL